MNKHFKIMAGIILFMFSYSAKHEEEVIYKSPLSIEAVDAVVKEEMAKQNITGVVVGVVQKWKYNPC
jgi:hypothetical protein